nr:alpha/beta hydrolase [Ornithinimicrobium sediminis]
MARLTNGVGPGVVTDDGVLLHTRVEGSGDAPVTVVFVHGFAVRSEEFDAQRRALGSGARVVLFDHRGHGRSGWAGRRPAAIDRLACDLGQVVDQATGTGPVVIVGHSMGGMATIALAEQRPELFGSKVVGVALISASAGHLASLALPPTAAHIALRSGLAHALLWGMWLVAPVVDAVAPLRRSWGLRWLDRRLFGSDQASGDTVRTVQDMWVRTPQSMVAAFFFAMTFFESTEALEVLGRVPTLVLSGADDATIPARRAELIAQGIGDSACLVLVPGAGHMVNMTYPGVVNAALRALLDRVLSSRCEDGDGAEAEEHR